MKGLTRSLLPLLGAALVSAFAAVGANASTPSSLTASLTGANCGATSAVFAPWGDASQYYLATSGGFEAGAPGWTLNGGAAVVAGNEPFHVHSATDSSSLLIPAGASAISPDLCFGALTPNVRFFAVADGAPATIHVRLVVASPLGALSVLDGGTATVGSSWAPTPVFTTTVSQLESLLGAKVQVEISSTAPVQIDDIYVDPFVAH